MAAKNPTCTSCEVPLTAQNRVAHANWLMCKPCRNAADRAKRRAANPPEPKICRTCKTPLTKENRPKNRSMYCRPCYREHVRKQARGRPPQKRHYTPRYKRDKHGRECRSCRRYKPWDHFPLRGARTETFKNGVRMRGPSCRECNAKNIGNPSGHVRRITSAPNRSPHAAVAWRDKKKLKQLAAQRHVLKRATGKPHHVDHIVPLRGTIDGIRLVSGLHWEGNLRVIPAEENQLKGGHIWPEMPEYTPADLEEIRVNANL